DWFFHSGMSSFSFVSEISYSETIERLNSNTSGEILKPLLPWFVAHETHFLIHMLVPRLVAHETKQSLVELTADIYFNFTNASGCCLAYLSINSIVLSCVA